MSDGAPTIPKFNQGGIRGDDSEAILRSVQPWNALGRVKIHSVGLGLINRQKLRNHKNNRLWPSSFLRLLAEQNGGKAVFKRSSPLAEPPRVEHHPSVA